MFSLDACKHFRFAFVCLENYDVFFLADELSNLFSLICQILVGIFGFCSKY